jgi:polyhydroxybutyrate depolymerase
MKLLLFILLVFLTITVKAQTTINGSFDYGGITRTYSFYVPASYSPGNPIPLVIGLHGTSSSGAEFEQYRDFRPIADTANFIMANPDGSTLFGVKFWNYGNVFGSTVDDVGFLEALIDTISAQYSVDQSRVYATGMSNGSFMCYTLACQSSRFAAIGTVTGSMSVSMYNNCVPNHSTPVLHMHGTDDGINPYEGTTSMAGIDETNMFWVEQNLCDTIPTVSVVPNINNGDGATAIHYLYSGGINGATVELYKINNGGHSWPGSPMPGSSEITCMDFDASLEIWRFFSKYNLSNLSVEEKAFIEELNIWPNPAENIVYISNHNNQKLNKVLILDMNGRIVFEEMGENIQVLNVANLKMGSYLIQVSGDHIITTKKLIIL